MTEKNQKKEEAKKQRNLWTMNPVTRVIKNRKGYDRARDRKNKWLYNLEETNNGTDKEGSNVL